ncbi:hypothetical protein [Listeria newyorkensis]|uniref:hypothetical protein n=1 Tax=Listeria newyorkensis TaxID=1497681 RepID=UPI00148548A0|nr:hypothetical protein [Listeria newyorkensis]
MPKECLLPVVVSENDDRWVLEATLALLDDLDSRVLTKLNAFILNALYVHRFE